jgi:hypothetical protein
MEQLGTSVVGFVDDQRSGRLLDRPILSSAELGADFPDAIVLIPSQHWRAIGRMLCRLGLRRLVDCSPILRRDRQARRLRDSLKELNAELSAATGIGVDEMAAQFPRLALDMALGGQLEPFSRHSSQPVFIAGTKSNGMRLRQMVDSHPKLFLAGLISDDSEPAFIDYLDVCPSEMFLTEESPDSQPLVLIAEAPLRDLALRLRDKGFARVVDLTSLLEVPEPPPPSEDIATPGGVAVWSPPGATLKPDAMARVEAIFEQSEHIYAIVGRIGSAITLVDVVFGAVPLQPTVIFVRGAASGGDLSQLSAGETFDLLCRLLCDETILWSGNDFLERLPAAKTIPAPSLVERARVLRRLFSETGFFGPDDVLWRHCLARHFVRDFAPSRSIVLSPPDRHLHNAVASLYERRGMIAQALAIRDSAQHFGDATMDGLACQNLLKLPGATVQEQIARQTDWSRRHAPFPIRPWPDPIPGPKDKITLGYICASAASSYFTYQVLPVIEKHDRSRYRVICYVDSHTACAAKASDLVRPVGHLDDEAFARQVRADRVDILIEVTGFSPGHRYGAMGARCAPIQISYINHAGTCGVPNVDYVLADALCVPTALQPWFSETIWHLPGSFFCFDFTSDNFPPVLPPPCLRTGGITFGCFASGGKINPPLIAVWAEILRRVPGSRLLLCNESLRSAANRMVLARWFARHGIPSDRLSLRPGVDRETIKHLYAEVDISLDTAPYCGGNTIAESLTSGVPVISMTGETFASRYGLSLLTASGCADLVAADTRGYVDLAVALAERSDRLVEYRKTLRAAMKEYGFSDSARFVRSLERAYEDMAARATAGEGLSA